jgi:hypothetical protein
MDYGILNYKDKILFTRRVYPHEYQELERHFRVLKEERKKYRRFKRKNLDDCDNKDRG